MPPGEPGMATLIAFGSLCAFVVVEGGIGMFLIGRLFERVRANGERIKSLEVIDSKDAGSALALAGAMGRLEAQMEHVVKEVDDLRGRLGWMGRVASDIESNR